MTADEFESSAAAMLISGHPDGVAIAAVYASLAISQRLADLAVLAEDGIVVTQS